VGGKGEGPYDFWSSPQRRLFPKLLRCKENPTLWILESPQKEMRKGGGGDLWRISPVASWRGNSWPENRPGEVNPQTKGEGGGGKPPVLKKLTDGLLRFSGG